MKPCSGGWFLLAHPRNGRLAVLGECSHTQQMVQGSLASPSYSVRVWMIWAHPRISVWMSTLGFMPLSQQVPCIGIVGTFSRTLERISGTLL